MPKLVLFNAGLELRSPHCSPLAWASLPRVSKYREVHLGSGGPELSRSDLRIPGYPWPTITQALEEDGNWRHRDEHPLPQLPKPETSACPLSLSHPQQVSVLDNRSPISQLVSTACLTMESRLASNSDPPVSASQVLGLQACSMPGWKNESCQPLCTEWAPPGVVTPFPFPNPVPTAYIVNASPLWGTGDLHCSDNCPPQFLGSVEPGSWGRGTMPYVFSVRNEWSHRGRCWSQDLGTPLFPGGGSSDRTEARTQGHRKEAQNQHSCEVHRE
jgi:hypothetical protein